MTSGIYKLKSSVYHMKYLFLLAFILLIPMSMAMETSLGTFKQNSCVNLLQTCTTCTFVNVSVNAPDSVQVLAETTMTKSGSKFTYQLCGNNQIGVYNVNGHGDIDGTDSPFTYTYEITPSGTLGGFGGTLGFYLIIIAIIVGVIALGFSIQEPWFVIIGGMFLMMTGIYSINSGVAGYRDMFMTWGIGLFEIGIGAYLAIKSGMELNDMEVSG